jgi:hypothetical protein
VGFRQPVERPQRPQLQVVSLWITPPEPAPPAAPLPERVRERSPSTQPVVAPPPQPMAPVTPPLAPRPDSNALPTTNAPPVDWANEASLAARRSGKAIGGPPASTTFSEPPKALAKACVPKESSMEWKGAAPLADALRSFNCAITIGFECKPNSHLLDDMKDPERQKSSVPDPNICD